MGPEHTATDNKKEEANGVENVAHLGACESIRTIGGRAMKLKGKC